MEHRHEVNENYEPEEVVSDLGNFELKPADYQVWVLGYDDKDEFVKEKFIQSFIDPEKAIEFARNFVDGLETADKSTMDSRIAYLNVLVETVVQVEGEDMDENVGTLFDEYVKVREKI